MLFPFAWTSLSNRKAVCLLAVSLAAARVCASTPPVPWTVPSPAELAMTSDPKAPGAPAIILSYEEIDDGQTAEVTVHVRIKVLTEAGRVAGDLGKLTEDVSARTIHPDGRIIPFVRSPAKKHFFFTEKGEENRPEALPDVTVGSIVEYVYHIDPQGYLYNPVWVLQRGYFVRSAHYTLKTPSALKPENTRWVANLPPGAALKQSPHLVDLDLANVAAQPNEDFMPPPTSIIFNVRFFYLTEPRNQFWGNQAQSYERFWNTFCTPRQVLKDAVAHLIQPGDSDDLKLHKLYDSVQQLENTELTRTHTAREDKQNGITRPLSADDIWTSKRGNSIQLTFVFVAMAHAAGFEAHVMAVTSRNLAVFNLDVLGWYQLDSDVAIVTVDGKERYFDPGVRRCPFGHLAPWHANVMGISVHGTEVRIHATPAEPASAYRTDRMVDLTIDAAGQPTGTGKISWVGLAGLPIRMEALTNDEQSVRTTIEKLVQTSVPAGVEIKLQSVEGLTDPETPVVAKFAISGKLGTVTSKRLIVPAEFFASSQKAILAAETRTVPIAFPAAYILRDQMNLHLPANLSAETIPEGRFLKVGTDSDYTVRVQPPSEAGNVLITQRVFALNRLDYKTDEYPRLHDYFVRQASFDQDPIVLQTTSPATAASASPLKD